MTRRKKICASLIMLAVFAVTTFSTAFLYPARTVSSVKASSGGSIKEVTEQYASLAYDTDKFGTNVSTLSDVAKKEKYITLIADLPVATISDAAGDDTVHGIVGSARYNDTAKKIKTQQNKLLRALKKAGISYTVEARYNTVLSGVAVEIETKDFERAEEIVQSLGGEAMVSELYYSQQTLSYTTDGVSTSAANVTVNDVNVHEETGIFDSSDVDYDGTGVVVAVLDSGFDYTHTAFTSTEAQPDSSKIAMTRSDVADRIVKTRAYEMDNSLTAADVYVSDKIPYAYDYADKDADVYPLESEHGTHVASIISGADDVITGVAPKAQLVLMKVFSDVDEGAKQSDILRAVEDSVTLGVDVINMSLGMNAGFAREDDTKRTGEIYDAVRDEGISLIAAASNAYNSTYGSEANGNLPLTSNPDSGSVGSPSTYEAALSVASISGVKTAYMEFNGEPIYYLEASNAAGKLYDFVDIMLKGNESASFQYVTVPGIGDSYVGVDVKGKIALVRRGRTTFEEKVAAAYRAGAIGVIIYNNVSGDIRMSVGNYLYDWGIGCISMSQDDGEKLAAQSSGVIRLSKNNLAGPFMSDFSSWGPAPDLGIKPEITAHGGEIYAAIPGQGYDRLSGTSMASPNQAGVHALVRQYVIEHFDTFCPGVDKEKAEGRKAIAAVTNQLLMSTTDIAYNEFGNPYSVRKQGAGLANLLNAVNTNGYVTVKDKNAEEERELDRTKLELGDDPQKTGVYTFDFTVKNISATDSLTYTLGALTYTETVSKTLTDKDKTVSSERAYMLDDTAVTVSGNGVSGNRVTVGPHSQTEIRMTLTLSAAAKKYLDDSFENGMYVEGFVTLKAESGSNGGIHLNVPYLAFYGDWTQAPMFDLTYFETNPDEINEAIDDEDKTKPDAYATRPLAGFTSDYIGHMGAYYFQQDPSKVQIPAQEEHISMTNSTDGLNYIYSVWAGLLRPAKTMDVTITDVVTGRQIYQVTKTNQRKSNSYGAGISMSAVDIGFHVADYDLKNNTQYTVKLEGHLDYTRDGATQYDEAGKVVQEATNRKNTYEFTFTTDFEAPKITDVRYYTEYDDATKQTKLFADIDVYDNHYAMALRVGTWNGRTLVEEDYPTPIYGDRNSTSTVTVELTDWMKYTNEAYPTPGKFMVFAYDYAMNSAIYELTLPQDVQAMYFAESEIKISRYETKELQPVLYPAESFASLLVYESDDENIAKVVDGTLVGVNRGTTYITVKSGSTDENAADVSQRIRVTVLGEEDPGFSRYDRPIVKSFALTGYHTDFAYYERFSDSRNIGTTDSEIKFGSKSLTMFPGESITLRWNLSTYFDADISFSSSDESVVKVDAATGKITAVGTSTAVRRAVITAVVNGTNNLYTDAVVVSVENPYVTNSGAYLSAYKGIGEDNAGNVEIPARLNITQISEFAFSLTKSVDKETEPTEEDPYYTTSGPVGEQRPAGYRIKSVIIPEGVEVIGRYAFAYMTSLEKVYLPSTLRQINAGAFEGCASLTTVVGLENVKIISKDAFKNCSKLNNTKRFSTPATVEFRLDAAIGIGAGAFSGTGIRKVELPNVQSAGVGAFENCTSLTEISFASKIKIDSSIFKGCTNVKSISINAPVIADEAFADCKNLTRIVLGADVAEIGARAFAGTKIAEFKVDPGNTVFTADATEKGLLYRGTDKSVLAAVAPGIALTDGTLTLPQSVTRIGVGAFSNLSKLTSVTVSDGTDVDDYAFYGCASLTQINGVLGRVGTYAFAGTSLATAPILGGASSVGAYAFAQVGDTAPQFTTLTVPAECIVGEGAFYSCAGLENVTIGKDAVLGFGAFYGCTRLQSVAFTPRTVGGSLSEITVGDYAFYNCGSLTDVEGWENVVAVGNFAFSGDTDNAVPQIASLHLSSAKAIGMFAFAGNRTLTEVTVADVLATIGDGAFYGAESLETWTGNVSATIGLAAFAGAGITDFAPFAQAAEIGAYAFSRSQLLGAVDLTNVEKVGEGAFSGTQVRNAVLKENSEIPAQLFAGVPLTQIGNLETVTKIGAEAFADAQITEADVSAAQYIGRLAFRNSALRTVRLGEALADMGDNPFAGTLLGRFSQEAVTDDDFHMAYTSYDFAVSDTVKVIDGALYVQLRTGGLELVTYPGAATAGAFTVAEGTVRVSDYAAAYNVFLTTVNLPYSLRSVGHAAFYGCNRLAVVNFGSIAAPVLEAAYDADYIEWSEESGANGQEALNAAQLIGMKSSKYAANYTTSAVDVLFNNNFIGYVGKVHNLTMTYPKNGTGYDAYVMDAYFDHKVVAATVADDVTRNVIAMIDALPSVISLNDAAAVAAARLAYDQISDAEQAALVTNLETLQRAERSIRALQDTTAPKPDDEKPNSSAKGKEGMSGGTIALIVIVAVLGAGLIAVVVLWQWTNIKKLIARIGDAAKKNKEEKASETESEEDKAEEAESVALSDDAAATQSAPAESEESGAAQEAKPAKKPSGKKKTKAPSAADTSASEKADSDSAAAEKEE